MKAAMMALVLLCLSAVDVGAVQLPAAGTTDGLGMNIYWDDHQSPYIDGILSTGAKAVRVFMNWDNVEVTQGNYTFGTHFDQVVDAYAAHGVRVLLSMTGGNRFGWYGGDFTSQAWQTGFTNFAAATAAHYKGKNNVILEVWNEPDQGDMTASTYMALLSQVSPAMRRADPNCTIFGPNVGLTNASQWVPGAPYMTTCIQNGLLDLVDAFSVHPYRSGLMPETVVSDYATVRSLMQTYGGRTLPIVSSEWGYSTGQTWATVATAQLQGDYLARSFLVNMSQGIPLSLWYAWRNEGTDPIAGQQNFGMVDVNLVPKPAYNEMKLLTTSLRGETFTERLTSPSWFYPDRDWLLVFTAPNGQETLAAWTTGNPRTVNVPGWGTLHLTNTPFYVNPSTVPEPSGLTLLGSGLAWLAIYTWRRKRSGRNAHLGRSCDPISQETP